MKIKNVLFLAFIAIPLLVIADEAEESKFGDHADSQDVPGVFSDFEGEAIDLRTRQLILQNTDLTIPGNGDLDIVVSRSHNKVIAPNYGQPDSMANWHLDVPMIWGNNFAGCDNPYPGFAMKKWITFTWDGFSPVWLRHERFDPDWETRDYYGLTLSIPGQPNRELLFEYQNGPLQDGKGGRGISYITTDNWRAECYTPPGATSAYAFLVISPDGTQYFFEKSAGPAFSSTWWEDAQYNCRFNCVASSPELRTCTHVNENGQCDEIDSFNRNDQQNGTYARVYDNLWEPRFYKATKIEDLYGNTLEYKYNENLTNTNGLAHLTSITSNDGRSVTFDYNYYPNFWLSQHVHLLKTATANDGRSVNYTYAWSLADYDGVPHLRAVWLPGWTRFWQYDYVKTDDRIEQFTRGIRVTEVQNPEFGRVIYRYEKTSSEYYGGISNRRPIYGNVKEREVWNAYWNTIAGTMDEWKLGIWDFTASQLITTESINRTTVTDPIGYIKKYDFARNRNSWRHGLLIKNTVEDPGAETLLQKETTYEWQQRAEIGENNAKDRLPSIKYQRALVKRTIAQDGATFVTEFGMFDWYNLPSYIKETGNTVKGKQYIREKYIKYHYPSFLQIVGQPEFETIAGVGHINFVNSNFVMCPSNSATPILPGNTDPVPVGCAHINRIREVISGIGVKREYNAKGKVQKIDNYGVSTEFTYHPNGEIHTVTDGNNKVTRFENYHRGTPESVITPEYTVSRNVLDSGLVEWEKDGRLNQTSYKYDDLSRVTEITRPIHNVESKQYFTFSTNSTRGGRTNTQYYNGLNEVTKRISSDSELTRHEVTFFDELGRKLYNSFPEEVWNGTVWHNGHYLYYDALSRLTFREKWVDDVQFNDNAWMSYVYEADGIGVWDQKYQYTKLFYASYGDPNERYLVGMLLPPDEQGVQAEYKIERDNAGKVKKITELVSGHVRENIYNSKQQLWKQINPETGTTEFIYDAAGNVKTKIVASGTAESTSTVYTYDGINRMTSIDYPEPTPDVSMGYDGSGNLDYVDNGIASWDYIYDANNNLTDEYLIIDGKRFRIAYELDSNDNLSKITYPSGNVIDFAPSARGIPTQALPYVTDAEFYATGHVKQLIYANGQNMWMELTPQKRLHSVSYAKSAQPFDVFLEYGYDLTENIDVITDGVDGTFSRILGYDQLNRLTSASGNWGAGSVTYDTVGNITTKAIGGSNLTYIYNPSTNLLESVSGSETYNLDHDVYGNVTATKPQNAFFYDDASNLRSASISATTLYNYAYDGNNRLVRTIKEGKTLYAAYDKNGRKVMEYSPEDDWIKETYYIGSTIIADRKLTALSASDTDGDGINDKVELENGMNLASAADRDYDPDQDGLGAFDEIAAGTDIYISDTDGDGINDGDEVLVHNTNPLNSDTDGDGVSDGDEVLAGTDPNVNIPAVMSIINNLLLED